MSQPTAVIYALTQITRVSLPLVCKEWVEKAGTPGTVSAPSRAQANMAEHAIKVSLTTTAMMIAVAAVMIAGGPRVKTLSAKY